VRVFHLTTGADSGGGKTHIISLLSTLVPRIDVRLMCFTTGNLYQEARERDIPTVLLGQRGRWDLSVIGRLTDLLGRENAGTILHSHGPRANFLTALARPPASVPRVTTIHSDYRLDFKDQPVKRALFTPLNAMALRSFNYYIAVTDQFKEMLASRHFPPDRIFVVYNGLDFSSPLDIPPARETRARWGIPEDELVVGCVGRLHPVKGQEVILRAAALLAKQEPHLALRYVFVGAGTQRQYLEELARSLELDQHVLFLGHVSPAYPCMNAFDINVLASHSESMPFALLEGARLAKATVASEVGGVPRLILPGRTGLLFPPGSEDQLARCLADLAADTGLRARLGQALYDHAKSHFSLSALADAHIDIYQRILSAHSCTGGGPS